MHSNKPSNLKVLNIWDTKYSSNKLVEKGLLAKGAEVKSLALNLINDDKQLDPWCKALNVHESFDLSKSSKLQRLVGYLWMIFQIFKVVSREKEIRILCHFGQVGSRVLQLPFVSNKIFTIFYGHDISAAIREPKWIKIYNCFKKQNSICIVLCEDAKQRLINIGVPSKNIIVWNLPITLPPKILKKDSRNSSTVNFAMAARFIEKKGYGHTLKLMHKLKIQGIDFKLQILGYGPLFTEYLRMSVELEIDSKINWYTNLTGKSFEDQFLKVLSESDFYLYLGEPANNGDDEGGPPLSIIYAQASGVPVISRPFAGDEITIVNNKTALYFDSSTFIEDIAQVILDFTNGKNYNEIGEAGKIIARKEFNPSAQITKLFEIIKKL